MKLLVPISLLLAATACRSPTVSPTGEFLRPADPYKPTGDPRLDAAQLQLFVVPFNRQVRELPGFSDLYIEHEPIWHVVVAFTPPPPPRERIVALAPAPIRDRILVLAAKRTAAEITAANEAIVTALNRTGVDYTGGYDPKTQRFEVKVASPEQVERMRAAIPHGLRADTDVVVGPLPVPE